MRREGKESCSKSRASKGERLHPLYLCRRDSGGSSSMMLGLACKYSLMVVFMSHRNVLTRKSSFTSSPGRQMSPSHQNSTCSYRPWSRRARSAVGIPDKAGSHPVVSVNPPTPKLSFLAPFLCPRAPLLMHGIFLRILLILVLLLLFLLLPSLPFAAPSLPR